MTGLVEVGHQIRARSRLTLLERGVDARTGQRACYLRSRAWTGGASCCYLQLVIVYDVSFLSCLSSLPSPSEHLTKPPRRYDITTEARQRCLSHHPVNPATVLAMSTTKPATGSAQPPPRIPERVIEVPEQRLYILSLGVACQVCLCMIYPSCSLWRSVDCPQHATLYRDCAEVT